jgi:hypothetical protein
MQTENSKAISDLRAYFIVHLAVREDGELFSTWGIEQLNISI